ncbi:MAG TPA: inorganic phosphate transporter [Candidatus Angelobacter sp.]|nr:inorganic phosphate transporter [Candidatus Angelobacter sp.]
MHLNSTLILTAVTVLVALTFDFINGFHDAANSIATVVSTRVLSPRLAVGWAAIFNFIAAFVLGIAVAKTIGKGLIDLHYVTQYVVLAGLLGAIIWDLATWYWGLPTSSSHALIGGYAGAAIARSGFGVIIPSGWNKTLLFIVVSPLLGFVLGLGLMVATSWILRRATPRQVDRWFRWLQLVSSAGVSLAHGGNDAQKTMGIVAGALFAGGYITQAEMNNDWGRFHYPIIFGAYIAIALGTYFGGWRIIRTMGTKITKLKPVGGFCAEAAAALTLMGTALTGIPVSTTHTITGAIVGVGSTQHISAVRWGIARRIVWAWVLTIPAAALMAAIVFWLIWLVHRTA